MELPNDPRQIRYIKLGLSGAYADGAIEHGDIPLNFPEARHASCVHGDWHQVRDQLLSGGRSNSAARDDLRQLKDFYELPAGSLWISFAQGHLWWCMAADEIIASDMAGQEGPTRARRTRDGWHNT